MLDSPDPNIIGSLLDVEEWRKSFEKSMDRLIVLKRKELIKGNKSEVGQWIDRQLTSMQLTEKAIEKEYPKAAEALRKAREKLAKLLY